MTLPNRKARAEGGDRRADENINNTSIIPQHTGNNGKPWFKMLFAPEIRMLLERGASAHEIATYCALTRFDDPLNDPHCVPASAIAADIGLTEGAVNKTLYSLRRKGIIITQRRPFPGKAATYMVCPPSEASTHCENEMCETPSYCETEMREGACDEVLGPSHCENEMQEGGTHCENEMVKEYFNNKGAAAPLKVATEPTPTPTELTAAERTKAIWRRRGHHE